MSSTRNRNSPAEYRIEKEKSAVQYHWTIYEHGSCGRPTLSFVPGDGIVGGSGRVHCSAITQNGTDVESMLRGIGSTNLENPQSEVVPEWIHRPSLNMVDRKLPVYLPRDIEVSNQERPLYR